MTAFFQAVRENVFGHVTFVQARTPGMRVRDLGGAVLVDSGLASDTFNKVLWGCDGQGGPAEAERREAILRAASDWFAGRRPRELDVPGLVSPPATDRPFTLWACAEDEGAHQGQRAFLEGRGYRVEEQESGMALPLGAFAEGEAEAVRIVPVESPAQVSAFAEVMAANWTPPDEDVKNFYKIAENLLFKPLTPMRLFVGFAGDAPVASGELFLSDGGNTAGLHMICTRESFRRKGFGTAMTRALLRAGRSAGASLAVLLASRAGEPVYRRLGFERCGFFAEYASTEEILF